MEKKFKKIAVLTSGGDAPGMNPAVRAVVRKALSEGVEVVGALGGYKGLIENALVPFTPRSVSNVITKGGTFLYSDRCLEFKTEAGMQKAIETCKKNDIDGIVVIGGDGTFRGATDLTNRGIPCVGIPGTIDNDIGSTEYAIGFNTAMDTVQEMTDRLRDTCESHARCNVIEVMGRGAGDIAVNTAISCGATAVAIPEIPFDEEAAINKIIASKKLGKRCFIVIVSEGLGHEYGEILAKKIDERTGIETKFARLAHVVRGGSPTVRDRITATRMGIRAVEELLAGNSNLIICERANEITVCDIGFGLIVDRMYKNTLKEGDLEKFTPEQLEEMKKICARRDRNIKSLYDVVNRVNI